MNELAVYQIGNNAANRDGWETFRAHRARVTELLRGDGAGRSRLCVLGAGNLNDLDLVGMVAAHREVHLVDLDADALAHGAARQGFADCAAVRLHGNRDVTGVFDDMGRWTPQAAIAGDELTACLERPRRHVLPALPGPFEVVASTCLLSQLVNGVVRTVGERHPQFLAAVQAVRAGHLRLLADLVAPGGVGVLITDIVSSKSFAPLTTLPENQLPNAIAELLKRRNFFHGLNPAVLTSAFRTDPVLAHEVGLLEEIRPWVWDFGWRAYLVCAWKFRKQLPPESAP